MAPRLAGRLGTTDRVARATIGFILVTFALFCPFAHSLGAVVTWGSGIVGAVLLVTAAVKVCPLYRMLGICTV